MCRFVNFLIYLLLVLPSFSWGQHEEADSLQLSIQLDGANLAQREVLSMLGLVAALVAYGLAISFLGFAIATVIFASALMIWRGVRWWTAILISAAMTAIAVSLFVHLFKVDLPRGALGIPLF